MASEKVGEILKLSKHGAEIARRRSTMRKHHTEQILHDLEQRVLEDADAAHSRRPVARRRSSVLEALPSHGASIGRRRSSILPRQTEQALHELQHQYLEVREGLQHSENPESLRKEQALQHSGYATIQEEDVELNAENVMENRIPEELEKKLEEMAIEEELREEEEEEGLSQLEIFLLSCLIFSLFFPDIWDYENYPVDQDYVRNTVIIILFFIFCCEIVMLCFEDHLYFGSPFFFLDCIGTLVLALDTTWIINLITGGSSVSILRATRASKIGVRSKEVFKLLTSSFKLLRLIRPMMNATAKGFNINWFEEKKAEHKKHLTKEQLKISDDLEGKQADITEAFSFRIAGIVMVLIILVPFLQVNFVDFSPNSWVTVMRMTGKTNTTTAHDINYLAEKINKFYHIKDDQLYYLKLECPYVNGTFEQQYHTRNSLVRDDNVIIYATSYKIQNQVLLESSNPYASYYVQNENCRTCYSYFQAELHLDGTEDTLNGALFSMLSTLLVILVLFFGTSTITSVMEKEILQPLRDALLELVGGGAAKELNHHEEGIEKVHKPVTDLESNEEGRGAESTRPFSIFPRVDKEDEIKV